MRLLLDTHVFLWWLGDVGRLAPSTRDVLSDATNEVFVSAASGWEISIKRALGKLHFPFDVGRFVDESGFRRLHVGFEHTEALATLPMHHPDPFDRLLVAQARVEGLCLVTADEKLSMYDIERLDA